MGLFDTIVYEAPCPKCGTIVNDWQSKAGPCLMTKLEPWEVDNFHGSCDGCGAWLIATVDAEVRHIVDKLDINIKVTA